MLFHSTWRMTGTQVIVLLKCLVYLWLDNNHDIYFGTYRNMFDVRLYVEQTEISKSMASKVQKGNWICIKWLKGTAYCAEKFSLSILNQDTYLLLSVLLSFLPFYIIQLI